MSVDNRHERPVGQIRPRSRSVGKWKFDATEALWDAVVSSVHVVHSVISVEVRDVLDEIRVTSTRWDWCHASLAGANAQKPETCRQV